MRILVCVVLALTSVAPWVVFYDDTSAAGTAVLGGYRDRWFLFNGFLSYVSLWGVVLLLGRPRKKALVRIALSLAGLVLGVATLETCAFFGLVDFRATFGVHGSTPPS